MATKPAATLPSIQGYVEYINLEHLTLTIRIKVGKGKNAELFDIHRGLLSCYSGYFRAAIKNIEEGKFAEGESGIIALDEDKVDVFKRFTFWLYGSKHKLTDGNDDALSYLDLAKIWCFAEQRIVPKLQNRAINVIISKMAISKMTMNLPIRAFKYIYENTKPDSALRRIVVLQVVNTRNVQEPGEDWAPSLNEEWFVEFAKDLAVERLSRPPLMENQKPGWDQCHFHVHEKDIRCSEKGWKVYQ